MERPDHLPLVTVSVLEREHEEMVSDFTFFNFAFWKLLLSKNPRSHGKSSGEVAQYNAQARWRRRWADQSLLCPLNYFFKRVRGQVVFCREASLFVIMMLPFFGILRCLVRPSIQLPGWNWTSTKKDLHIREHLVLHLPFSREFLWPSTPGAQELSLCFLNCEHVTFKS